MRIAVTGSITTDHLMAFPGRLTERLVPEGLPAATLFFLVDRLTVRYSGAGANVAYGLGQLGLSPVLVGAAGADFTEYHLWLKRHGVDADSVLVVPDRRTARSVRTVDADGHEICSFHAGAREAARTISLRSVSERVGTLDLVLVSSDDTEAMLRHTEECRAGGVPFAADPRRRIAGLGRADARFLVDGARMLFTGEEDAALLHDVTGWSALGVLERVGTRFTTLGPSGVLVERSGRRPVVVPAVPDVVPTGPSGAGDALRAGVLAGLAGGVDAVGAARLGCALASLALDAAGPQEYTVDRRRLYRRLLTTYGRRAAHALSPVLAAAAGPARDTSREV
ncbi:kinase [Streptomyces ruber]|uniref:Kinase n=2 Tax=Streptomyces TaxID=1883 RepID=A0A918BB47_9ACTN|nr:PfkB family carbohydrate kinase [Streptomyces ruber]GGQ47863.1 kinase [Streptomyces ruber]